MNNLTPIVTLENFVAKAQSKVVLHGTKLWDLPTYRITLGADTEYVQRPNRPNLMLTTQLALTTSHDDCVVLEHPLLGKGILPSWSGTCILSTVLGWEEIQLPDLGFGVTGKKQEYQQDGYLLWEHLMFFAPADLLAGLFNDFQLMRSIQRYCKQDARIRVETDAKEHKGYLRLPIYLNTPYGALQVILRVVDFGKLSVGSLEDNVKAFGGKMMDKSTMDAYKTNMLEPYTNPELLPTFIDYAKDDACQLFFLRTCNQERTKMLFETHGLELPEREIVTTGSLVARLFQSYIDKYIGTKKAYELFKVKDREGNLRSWSLEDMLKKSTVEYFAGRKETNKAALALVQGGRAKNELPLLITQDASIADIDLSGAYVTIQQVLTYPVGLPSTYGVHKSSEKEMTLRQFLKWKDKELEQRLYTIVVSGKLSKEQTLVPSKVVEVIKIIDKYNDETCKIPADFRLYTMEIVNGVITSDVLETLRNVCSNQEWSEWMDLRVVAAAWYSSELRCDTAEDWYSKTKDHTEKYGNSVEEEELSDGRKRIADNRSRYWLAVPLKEFLAPYAQKRKELKAAMKLCPKGTPEYDSLNAQQNAMKLVGNTNYGVLASPYFPVGNVVIANNITAAARVAVWLTATALGCAQTITDGGAYDLNKVRYWGGRKPSLYTLSMFRKPEAINHKVKLQERPLGDGSPWILTPGKDSEHTIAVNGSVTYECKESGWVEFDKMALDHVKHFFRSEKQTLSILDVISYEHKDFYVKAIYHSQTNYCFHHSSGAVKIKARGYKVKGKPYMGDERATIIDLFEDLDKDPHRIPPYRKQYISQVLKCNQANEMLESKEDNIYKQNGLIAGDSVIKQKWTRPLSLSMFHWQSDEQFQSWKRTTEGLKDKSGWGLEQYFLNTDGTFDYQRAIETIQSRIDEGALWLTNWKGGKGQKKEVIKAEHPHLKDTLE